MAGPCPRHTPNNTILIPNRIDQKTFQPAKDVNERSQIKKKLGISENDVVLISVGSCTEIKNHSDVIIALAELIKDIQNICYIHIGEGPLQKREKLP